MTVAGALDPLTIAWAADGRDAPALSVQRVGDSSHALVGDPQVRLGLLLDQDPYCEVSGHYTEVTHTGEGVVCTADVEGPGGGRFSVRDTWKVTDGIVEVCRAIVVKEPGAALGVRSDLALVTRFSDGLDVHQAEFLAPSVFYRRLDMDRDGVPDHYPTYDLAWAEDKLSAPVIMAFAPEKGWAVALYRSQPARLDENVQPHVNAGERFFCSATDVGSLGFRPAMAGGSPQIALVAHYPFYEGSVSYALSRQGAPWGAFARAVPDAVISVRYAVVAVRASGFAEASWGVYRHLLDRLGSTPVALAYSEAEAHAFRLDLADRFFYSYPAKVDPRRPAGYIINQHPTKGVTLGEVFEYGFCGQQALTAYCLLRRAHDGGLPEYRDHALATLDFLVREVIGPNGFTEQVYSCERQAFVSWFSGTMLPYSFAATPEERATFLGAETVHGLAQTYEELARTHGGFTRILSDEGSGLLMAWEWERRHGIDHTDWLAGAGRIGEFLLACQTAEGAWYRAVDTYGNPKRFPELWFGRTEEMRTSSTVNDAAFMLRLYEVTGDVRYFQSGLAGCDYALAHFVDDGYMYGSIIDHPMTGLMRASGPVLDNEGPLYTMEALLLAQRLTGEQRYLDGAARAGMTAATWVNLWDIPMPPGTPLAEAGFRSTGWSPACIYAGNFQMDNYPLYFLSEFARLARLTGDEGFTRISDLMRGGMNDMVSTPSNTYGYAHYGAQSEGRVGAWLLLEEWGRETGVGGSNVGGRGKGNNTSIAYGWMVAMPVAGYYRLIDEEQEA